MAAEKELAERAPLLMLRGKNVEIGASGCEASKALDPNWFASIINSASLSLFVPTLFTLLV